MDSINIVVRPIVRNYKIVVRQGGSGGVSSPLSDTYTALAGENISGGKVVVLIDGKFYYYEPSLENMYGLITGISKGAASINTNINVQLSGNFYESGLGLTPNKIYYAGNSGNLILDPTGLKIVQPIGVSLGINNLNINIKTSILTI